MKLRSGRITTEERKPQPTWYFQLRRFSIKEKDIILKYCIDNNFLCSCEEDRIENCDQGPHCGKCVCELCRCIVCFEKIVIGDDWDEFVYLRDILNAQ